MRRLIVLAAGSIVAMLVPGFARAHGSEPSARWLFDPWTAMPMAAVAVMYLLGMLRLRARGVSMAATRLPALTSFLGGYAALFAALVWPLEGLGDTSFAAHMAQHMLLIAVAAPLLTVARPGPILLAALPARLHRINAALGPLHRLLRVLSTPYPAFSVHAALVWLWHAPLLYELALRWQPVHVLEHAAFLGGALLFWHAMRRAARGGGEGCGTAALLTLGTLMHTGLLGALLTFSPRLLMPIYEGRSGTGLSPIEDQQLAGLLMWIPGSLCYLAAGLYFIAGWLRQSPVRTPR